MPSDTDVRAALEPSQFIREDRYIVVKRSRLNALQQTVLRYNLAEAGIGTVECVVVESDWPEYEPVWRMIEARCAALQPSTAISEDRARTSGEIEREWFELAERPCETAGLEDMEGGCCAPCRARVAILAFARETTPPVDAGVKGEAIALALCNEDRRFMGFSPYDAAAFAALEDHRRRDWLRYAGVIVALSTPTASEETVRLRDFALAVADRGGAWAKEARRALSETSNG